MKKKLLAMAMAACLSIGVIGCGSNSVVPVTTESETEATMWPRDGAAGMLPIPNKESGTVDTNATDYFFATVTDYSLDLFNEYVNTVKEAGFTENFTQYEDWYRAFNDAEDDLMLTYDDDDKTMEISFYVHKETDTAIESETESTAPESSETSSDEIRPETKEALDSYEEFMGEYVDFMQKYNENSSDATLLKDYASYMTKYADFTDKFNKMKDDLNDAELKYYLKVQARILDKLSEVQ